MNENNKHVQENYIEHGGFFNRLLFLFALPILKKGSKNYLEETDLGELEDDKNMEIVYNSFMQHYQKGKEKGNSLPFIFFSFVFDKWLKSNIMILCVDFLNIFHPFILMRIIDWFNSNNTDTTQIYKLIGCTLLITLVNTIGNKHGFRYMNLIHMDLIFVFNGMFFDKMKKVSLKAYDKINISKMNNTISTDVQRIAGGFLISRKLIRTPVIIIAFFIILYAQIGWICFLGIFTMFVSVYIVLKMSKLMTRYSKEKFEKADERNALIKNAFSGIKMLKFNVWEGIAYDRINKVREQELKSCRKMIFIKILCTGLTYFIPLLSSFVCILAYMMKVEKEDRSLGVIFFIIFIFGVLKNQYLYLFTFAVDFQECYISFKRAEEILSFPDQEDEDDIRVNDRELKKGECRIESGDFSYYSKELIKLKKSFGESNVPDNPELVLNDINLSVKPGEFIAVVGEVGSGKSSLLKTICKSLYTCHGGVKKNGKIGYMPQKSFTLNTTFKKNIVFGSAFDQSKYKKVIKYCELIPDLELLPAGDRTEIGERGVNLSGGQKQRLNIGRTVYEDCDIYLIDDCLSALDNDKGTKIFKNVFVRMLQNKTKIMVTHDTQYLNKVDRVIYMHKGRIIGDGTYEDLLSNNRSFEFFITKNQTEKKTKTKQYEEVIRDNFSINSQFSSEFSKISLGDITSIKNGLMLKEKGKLTTVEKRFKGNVSFKVYKEYLFKSGYFLFTFNLLLLFSITLTKFISEIWVSKWCKGHGSFSSSQYIFIYTLLLFSTLFMTIVSIYQWAKNMTSNSHQVFDSLIKKVFKKKIEFFDTTPIGQLINLCSQDTDIMDITQPTQLAVVCLSLFQVLMIILTTIIGNVILVFVFLTLLIFFTYISRMFLQSGNEVLRIKQRCLSPIISYMIEIHSGLIVFRSFNRFETLYHRYKRQTQKLAKSTYSMYSITIFTDIALRLFCIVFIGISLIVLTTGRAQDWNFVSKSPAVMAVTVNMILSLPFALSGLMMNILNVIISMGCVERLMYNVDNSCLEEDSALFEAPRKWINQGSIKAVNVCCRYRENLPLVLKDINFDIKSGERIGVLGRTGSGKSSLLLALTRMINIDERNNGYFEIDGVNTNTISLERLRNEIAVIPQDPFMLRGSLRFNVDPCLKASDEMIIEVLKKTMIWDSNIFTYTKDEEVSGSDIGSTSEEPNQVTYVLNDKEKLDYFIDDGGLNLSVGQRQLICIARSMIKKPKILLMDEATANIDSNTDAILQTLIKREFSGSTIITIAHRLDTIINYDRLFVIDEGCLVETGTLKQLMSGETKFKKIIESQDFDFKEKIRGLI